MQASLQPSPVADGRHEHEAQQQQQQQHDQQQAGAGCTQSLAQISARSSLEQRTRQLQQQFAASGKQTGTAVLALSPAVPRSTVMQKLPAPSSNALHGSPGLKKPAQGPSAARGLCAKVQQFLAKVDTAAPAPTSQGLAAKVNTSAAALRPHPSGTSGSAVASQHRRTAAGVAAAGAAGFVASRASREGKKEATGGDAAESGLGEEGGGSMLQLQRLSTRALHNLQATAASMGPEPAQLAPQPLVGQERKRGTVHAAAASQAPVQAQLHAQVEVGMEVEHEGGVAQKHAAAVPVARSSGGKPAATIASVKARGGTMAVAAAALLSRVVEPLVDQEELVRKRPRALPDQPGQGQQRQVATNAADASAACLQRGQVTGEATDAVTSPSRFLQQLPLTAMAAAKDPVQVAARPTPSAVQLPGLATKAKRLKTLPPQGAVGAADGRGRAAAALEAEALEQPVFAGSGWLSHLNTRSRPYVEALALLHQQRQGQQQQQPQRQNRRQERCEPSYTNDKPAAEVEEVVRVTVPGSAEVDAGGGDAEQLYKAGTSKCDAKGTSPVTAATLGGAAVVGAAGVVGDGGSAAAGSITTADGLRGAASHAQQAPQPVEAAEAADAAAGGKTAEGQTLYFSLPLEGGGDEVTAAVPAKGRGAGKAKAAVVKGTPVGKGTRTRAGVAAASTDAATAAAEATSAGVVATASEAIAADAVVTSAVAATVAEVAPGADALAAGEGRTLRSAGVLGLLGQQITAMTSLLTGRRNGGKGSGKGASQAAQQPAAKGKLRTSSRDTGRGTTTVASAADAQSAGKAEGAAPPASAPSLREGDEEQVSKPGLVTGTVEKEQAEKVQQGPAAVLEDRSAQVANRGSEAAAAPTVQGEGVSRIAAGAKESQPAAGQPSAPSAAPAPDVAAMEPGFASSAQGPAMGASPAVLQLIAVQQQRQQPLPYPETQDCWPSQVPLTLSKAAGVTSAHDVVAAVHPCFQAQLATYWLQPMYQQPPQPPPSGRDILSEIQRVTAETQDDWGLPEVARHVVAGVGAADAAGAESDKDMGSLAAHGGTELPATGPEAGAGGSSHIGQPQVGCHDEAQTVTTAQTAVAEPGALSAASEEVRVDAAPQVGQTGVQQSWAEETQQPFTQAPSQAFF